jgi:hypothetical protein
MKDMENIFKNKGKFKVYLGCHLKEVAILPDPHSNFLQTI